MVVSAVFDCDYDSDLSDFVGVYGHAVWEACVFSAFCGEDVFQVWYSG